MTDTLRAFSGNITGTPLSDEVILNGFTPKEDGKYPLTSDELNYFFTLLFNANRENWGVLRLRLANDVDLDEVLEAGTYQTAIISSDECDKNVPHEYNMQNYPSTRGGFVIVSRWKDFIESDVVLQKVIDYAGDEYTRVKISGQWCEWKFSHADSGGGDTTSDDSIYKLSEATTVTLPTNPIDQTMVVVIHRGGDFTITVGREDENSKIMGENNDTPFTISKMSYTRFIFDKDVNNWLIVKGDA